MYNQVLADMVKVVLKVLELDESGPSMNMVWLFKSEVSR